MKLTDEISNNGILEKELLDREAVRDLKQQE